MRKTIIWMAFCISFTSVLSGCGGNSGNPAQDTITLTVSGPTGTITTTYIEGTYNSQGELDPNMMSYVTALNYTHIQFLSGQPWTSGSSGFVLVVNDNKAQAYSTGGFPYDGYIDYDFFDPNNNHYTSIYSTESGTITLSSIGNVGEQITGTFNIPISNPTNTSDTLRLSGSFRVTRIAP
jgi:hypothetical protein